MYVTARRGPLPVEAKSFVRKIGGPKSFLFQKDPWPTMMLSTVYRTVCKAFPIIQEKTNAESTTQQWRNDQGLRKCTHTCALSQTTAFETERVVISPEHQILYRQISIVFNVELYRNCFCMFLLYWPPTVFVSMFVRPQGCAVVHVSLVSSFLAFLAGAAGAYLEQYDLATVGASKSPRR